MRVRPDGVFSSTGVQGGPFTPGAATAAVENTGTANLDWQAEPSEDWVQLSVSGGTLAPGDQAVLLVSFSPLANALLPGINTAAIEFTNLTNGIGNTTRGLTLHVLPGPGLRVLPQFGLNAAGPIGGPFAPASRTYTLSNPTSDPLDWTASTNEPWVVVSFPKTSPVSPFHGGAGTLPPGAQTTITVSLDPAESGNLSLGNHQALVTILDHTNSIGALTRPISLNVNAGAGGTLAPSVTQFGITWTFDQDYLVGQFANGDWWVVGPVTIVEIDPKSELEFNGRVKNGSMVNPSPRQGPNGMTQGYDSETYGKYAVPINFSLVLNMALAVSPGNPLVLQPHSSLVSTISMVEPGLRPQIDTAAVLTVVDAAPADGSFRPPYCGSDKTVLHNKSQLNWSLLADLAPVPSTPSWTEVESWFERPWIDHVPIWAGNYIHPKENMPNYGRDICDRVSVAALMLHIDAPDSRKETLLIRFVQLGIDLWGIGQDGGYWEPAAGHMSGRKWPILFAGLMLDDAGMSGVGFGSGIQFGEDGQTFYVRETPPGSGVYNNGYGGYGPQHLGMPEWGTAHSRQPWWDDADWFGDAYRLCCTTNAWWGQLLAAYIMGAKPLWNHDSLFDYQDRYLAVNRQLGILDWRLSWRDFYLDMWDTYRSNY